MAFQLQPTVPLNEHRCYDCGRWYATEASPSSRCPYCGERKAADRIDEIARLGRVVSALRGALTRARKR